MTQLISNAPMQPKPDAGERPIALVEKLEREVESLENSFEQFAILDDEIAMVHTATIAGLKMAINIVKQHQAESEWVRCAERLPKNPMFYLVDEEGEYFKARYFRGRWETSSKLRVYPEFWFDGKIGNPRKNIPVVLSKQPPREPQYLISKGGYWYRPNAKGYTASKHEAGRFSKEFAERHAKEVLEVRIFEDKENR